MNSSATLLATLALILPPFGGEAPDATRVMLVAQPASASDEGEPPTFGFGLSAPEPFRALEEARQTPLARQVRIEQRVIIRVAPGASDPRLPLMPEQSRRPNPQRFVEESAADCVPIGGITGVRPASDNRLVLFMRDRTLMSAALERTCNAADFYSGFYIERSDDGALCQHRDRLHSRAGASCRVMQFSRLVPTRD